MRDLIVFGEDFGGLPSSTQHLVNELSGSRKIVWVNSIGLRQPSLNRYDMVRALNKLCGKAKRGYQAHTPNKNITVVNLRTLPAPKSRLARSLAKRLMLSQLKPILAKQQLRSPILWGSLPTITDLCGHLNESAVVYYCGDDFSSLAGVDHSTIAAHEKRLVEKSDLILAASQRIADKFPSQKTTLLPHGVDIELFTQPAQRALDLPNSGRPIAGFYGSLSRWLDYSLIEQLCLLRPDWDFVFIGPNEFSQCPLPSMDNIHYLGPKAHHELPRYSQHWEASLIPFLPNQQIQACNPLKLLEYLAVGKPILATPFPALEPYQHYITVTHSAKTMAHALAEMRHPSGLPLSLIQNESWQARGHQLNTLLEQL